MRSDPEPRRSPPSALTWCLIGALALLAAACASSDTDENTQLSAESEGQATTNSSTDGTVGTTTGDVTTSSVTQKPPASAGSGTLLVEPEPNAVAAAEAVLLAVDARNDNVSDAYDIGGDSGCPLLDGFDGQWVAEAGGSVFCVDEAETFAVGAGRQVHFAELFREEAFEPFDDGSDTGPIGRWCNTESCIASWIGDGIVVYVFEVDASDPSSAESYLIEHLVELVDGVAMFDVELVPQS